MERLRLIVYSSLMGTLGAFSFFADITAIDFLLITILVLAITTLLPYIYEFRDSSPDPFAPTLWLAPWFFTTYGLHAVFRIVNENYTFNGQYYGPHPPTPIFIDIIGLATLGFAALLVGYYSTTPRTLVDVLPNRDRTWSSGRAALAIIVLFSLGFLGYLSIRPLIGIGPRSTLAKGDSKTAFIAVNLVAVAAIIALSNAALNIRWADRNRVIVVLAGNWKIRIPTPGKLAIAVLSMLTAVVILWSLGGRGRAFRLFVVGVFLVHYLVRPFRVFEWAGLYVLIELMPAWSAEITAAVLDLDISTVVELLAQPYFFKRVDWFAFNNITLLLAGMPEHLNYQNGRTFLSAFFAPFPIQPIPQTHVVFGNALAPETIRDQIGVSLTMVGELYLNFWVVGVLIGFLLIGIGVRLFYEWAIHRTSHVVGPVLFAAVANDFLLKGNFSNSAPSLGLILIPLGISLLFITRTEQRNEVDH